MPRKTSVPRTPPAAVEPKFYTTDDVATLLCTTRDTVEYWRRCRVLTGPLGVVWGRRVLYPRVKVHALIDTLIDEQTGQLPEGRGW